MSESEKERSEVAGGGGGGDGDGDRCKGHDRKAKRMSLFRFRKVKNQIDRRNKKGSDSSSTNFSFAGKRGFGGGGCYLCFKQPETQLDSPIGSHTSDPNNPEFSHGLLRALIEKNYFYSKECNPHIDIDK